jgi:hypothetical protein
LIQQDLVPERKNNPQHRILIRFKPRVVESFQEGSKPLLLYHAHKDDLIEVPRVLVAVPAIGQFVFVRVISKWASDRVEGAVSIALGKHKTVMGIKTPHWLQRVKCTVMWDQVTSSKMSPLVAKSW